ncbi:putative RNA-binding protein EIF1AD [Chionoecetes opilio]|uniref:Probable RNA-binding protein EIF1AD n=1 Tax=Chionoecetes opilio TaxID=41210 RepID=A0A8J5CN57_CHIOP|nr:putative RNA-binding protein EIF1AD [Chionoecetes opilio]
MSVTTKKKHVERELYEDFSFPQEHQSIVRVLKSCGNNLHQVTTAGGEVFLASMPHKFRKHVWIKRGNYVVTEPIPEGNKVKAEIVRILMKDHIRHIRANNMWPAAFSELSEEEKDKLCIAPQDLRVSKDSLSDSDDDDLMENPNRPRVLHPDSETDSDSDSSEESDADSDCANIGDGDSEEKVK